MKQCTKCGNAFPSDFFNIKRGEYRQTWCKNCTRQAGKEHYLKDKKYYWDKKQRYQKKNIEFVNSYKNKPCMDCCGIYPPYVLDFDHRENKEFNIANQVRRLGINKLKIEIEKCDLICSNCHRIRTWDRLRNKHSSLTQR